MSVHPIVHEKVDQAIGVLREKNIDVWLTFVRETALMRDPALNVIVSPALELTWHSAFLLTQRGDRIAIVGRFDKDNVAGLGDWREVVPYDQGIGKPLLDTLRRLNPQSIAINTSESDPAADGLSHGMWTTLLDILKGTPYARMISAEDIINALRGRKTATEISRVKDAIVDTEAIFDEITATLRPGLSEIEIAEFTHDRMQARGLTTAWDYNYCPVVDAGPESPVGHAAPTQLQTQRGRLLHIDFGVAKHGYVSDMQRTWYLLQEGETKPPAEAQRGFDAVRAAILAGADALRPGAKGWEVDRAARSTLIKTGYPEYLHATGHHIGQTVHDGATVLGPRWERYGESINGLVEPGNIFTLELGVQVPSLGFVGLEEDVLVKDSGIEWLSKPQTELICV
ncbi:MAG TPA: Xaa-Pro peptidase family protein [Anaerolineae bacterium]|nr:Xaa-Pro peptidase family protein [Anaerolineae bacterium]